ncbi:MAG: glutamate 5-kinase [Pseudomonadota bacterium]
MDPVTPHPLLARARRIVVKVGSALLVADGALRERWLGGLAADIAQLRAEGREVLAVSSGAIALGRGVLGLGAGALSLEHAQAAAAVGQQRLAAAWTHVLEGHGLTVAQVLLTLEDTQNRRRYLNGRATLATLLGLGVVPVVNENDTVATDEIRYGDNDRLAARVALMAGADLLVLLSDVDGLYTADPTRDPTARHLPEIRTISPEITAMAGDAGSGLSKGGMRTKILAAKTAMQGGCAMAVTAGAKERPLTALAAGDRASWFHPQASPALARKQWIAGMKPLGALIIDQGAANALARGKSLLPAGVVRVSGRYERGDPVSIIGPDGATLGAGLSGYSATDSTAIAGARSAQIAEILGYPGRTALVHRDDMVLWSQVSPPENAG